MDNFDENFEQFVRNFAKKTSSDFYKKFWAGTAIENGLTVKYDGKEFLVKPEEISCIDLGDLSGRCLCGHPIRYEYWFNQLGAIGSTCITTMTGLTGADLRTIIRGSKAASKERDELMILKEKYGTLAKQREEDIYLNQSLQTIHEADKVPEQVQKFIENNIPMPWSMRRLVDKIANQETAMSTVKIKYGEEIYNLYQICEDVNRQVHQIIAPYTRDVPSEKLVTNALFNINEKIKLGKASPAQLEYYKKLMQRLRNTKFVDACDVLVRLKQYDLGEFWNKIVSDNLNNALTYGLSDAQLAFILDKSSKGKDGLAIRFKDKLADVKEVCDHRYVLDEYQMRCTLCGECDPTHKNSDNVYAENDARQQYNKSKMSFEVEDEEEPPQIKTESNPW